MALRGPAEYASAHFGVGQKEGWTGWRGDNQGGVPVALHILNAQVQPRDDGRLLRDRMRGRVMRQRPIQALAQVRIIQPHLQSMQRLLLRMRDQPPAHTSPRTARQRPLLVLARVPAVRRQNVCDNTIHV